MAMAHTLITLLSLTTISFFLFTTNASPLVDNVCGQTRNPSLCKMSFTSDPRSETATLPVLADVADQLAGFRADTIKQTISKDVNIVTDPNVRGQLIKCDDFYVDALELLDRAAPTQIKNKQWGALGQLAVRVAGLIDSCEAVFKNNSPFRAESQVVAVFVDGMAVIAKNL